MAALVREVLAVDVVEGLHHRAAELLGDPLALGRAVLDRLDLPVAPG